MLLHAQNFTASPDSLADMSSMNHSRIPLIAAAALSLACALGATPAWSKTPSAKSLCKRQAAEQHLKGHARSQFLKTCVAQRRAQAKAPAPAAQAGAQPKPKHHWLGHHAHAAATPGAAPAQAPATATKASAHARSSSRGGNPQARVWVNLPTHTYHCSGDRYYGKTHSGQYMTQAAAQAAGDHAASGKLCS